MDIITISSPFNKDEFLKENMFRLRLLLKPLKRKATGFSITAGLFALLTLGMYMAKDHYIPFLLVTFIFCVIAFLLVHAVLASKKGYIKNIQALALEYQEARLNSTFEINDEGIHYSDNERTMNFKWSTFKYFSLCNDYLIVSMGEGFETAYFFSRHECGSSFDNFLMLLEKKLPRKTIKL